MAPAGNTAPSGGVLTVTQARHIVRQREDQELEKARRLVQAAQLKEENAVKRWNLEVAKEARKWRVGQEATPYGSLSPSVACLARACQLQQKVLRNCIPSLLNRRKNAPQQEVITSLQETQTFMHSKRLLSHHGAHSIITDTGVSGGYSVVRRSCEPWKEETKRPSACSSRRVLRQIRLEMVPKSILFPHPKFFLLK
ncbi:hypothetical protein B0I37DRAFT_355255 [Chaetomium sp. MPI-CAGE-AT-0009]|nr:hypothetical protein B0I37DRAFT_355255 [Chaetomium sp. MPI-CAGE-AT-0009]